MELHLAPKSHLKVEDIKHSANEIGIFVSNLHHLSSQGARCSSVVRAFAHGAMGSRIDHSWGGPIELFFAPARDPQLV